LFDFVGLIPAQILFGTGFIEMWKGQTTQIFLMQLLMLLMMGFCDREHNGGNKEAMAD
jgi:hypothetical protein